MSLTLFLKPHYRHQPGAWLPEWGLDEAPTPKEIEKHFPEQEQPPTTPLGMSDEPIKVTILGGKDIDKEIKELTLKRRRKEEAELIFMDLI